MDYRPVQLRLIASNENERPAAPREPRAIPSSPPELTPAEKSALAMLRCGLSFGQAAQSAALDVSRLIALWRTYEAAGRRLQ